MDPPMRLVLPDGRTLAFDDVGDPAGWPVVYLHGTPDSRLARHPDDGIAASLGIRLLALDRPGAGDSDPHPLGTTASLAEDVRVLLDHLDLETASLLGWSAGGLLALAVGADLGPRIRSIGLVGAVPPVEAYDDAALVASLGPARRPFVELARELTAAELAAEVAPYLVPEPLTAELALEHVLESAGEHGREELAQVPGAARRLARALAGSIHHGVSALAHDVQLQLEPGLDLGRVTAPVRCHHGSADSMAPPEVGAWLVQRLPAAVLDVVDGGGHHLLFPHWRSILDALRRDAGT